MAFRWFSIFSAAFFPLLAMAHATFEVQLASLNERLALEPRDAALHFKLAELYCEHEEPEKALAALDQVRSLGPAQLPVDYLSGLCRFLAGRPVEALVDLDRYVKANPENAPVRIQRARVQLALGNAMPGLDDYRAALRLTPQVEPELAQEAADALAAHGSSNEAIGVLDAALARLGPIPSLTLRAIDLEIATGRIDAALARVDLLQKAAPRPEPWMARRGAILSEAGRTAESRAAWSSLMSHLAELPNSQRTSNAMIRFAEQARLALSRL